MNVFETVKYGVNCREAAELLAADFGINAYRPPTQAVLEKRRQKSEAQQLTENERLCFSVLSEYALLLGAGKPACNILSSLSSGICSPVYLRMLRLFCRSSNSSIVHSSVVIVLVVFIENLLYEQSSAARSIQSRSPSRFKSNIFPRIPVDIMLTP